MNLEVSNMLEQNCIFQMNIWENIKNQRLWFKHNTMEILLTSPQMSNPVDTGLSAAQGSEKNEYS